MLTLHDLQELDVAFVSLTEAFDLTTPTGRAMAAMVAVFAEFEREIRSERVRAGIEQARREGRRLGRPRSALSLLSNAALTWNTVQIGDLITGLESCGEAVSRETLARVSLLVHRHIIPSGTYLRARC